MILQKFRGETERSISAPAWPPAAKHCQDRTFYLLRWRICAAHPAGRPSEARSRLLDTATRLFYAEGIHAVGIDRIVAEAQVTRATLYRHFPGKEDLVLAYLNEVDQGIRGRAGEAPRRRAPTRRDPSGPSAGPSPRTSSRRASADAPSSTPPPKYPEARLPVRKAVIAHRQWFLDTVTDLLADIRETGSAPAARHFVMMRDGAMAAGCLFDPALVRETFLRGVDGLLEVHTATT